MTTESTTGGGFSHEAVLYRQPAQYRSAVLGFVRDGLDRSEPVLVALPTATAELIRGDLAEHPDLTFADLGQLSRNPGRIIPAVWDFADRHEGRPVRFVSEPVWPGRSAPEIREAVAHEAMVNLAFAGAPVAMMCPYDASRLAPRVTAHVARTHPVLHTEDGTQASPDYRAGHMPRGTRWSLARPPKRAQRLDYTTDLRSVRAAVSRYAEDAGLTADRLPDLVIAVGEVIANTLRHTSGGGTVFIWRTRTEVICQISDTGCITDPLVGLRRPLGPGGLGLWVVNQVCDLVELRTGKRGTTIRMHMSLAADPPPRPADVRAENSPVVRAKSRPRLPAASVSDLRPAVSGVQAVVPDLQPAVSGVEPAVPDLQAVVPSVQAVVPGVVPGVQAAVPGLQPAVSGVEPVVSGVQPAVSGIEAAGDPPGTGAESPDPEPTAGAAGGAPADAGRT
jgi:anti-sigma regulatory factor (Ser/Thr protein kinase)